MEMMLAILMRIVFFLILIGVVVFVHELGHFLLARAVGVTVVRFSLGFGKRLFGFTRGGTEFVVSAVPLGGYCKFLGDDPEQDLPEEEKRRGFLTTDIWRRTLIVLAGPGFNLLLPLLVFFAMSLTATTLPPAIPGTVSRDGAAWQAGIRPGDKLIEIDGRRIDYWHQMHKTVAANPGRALDVVVSRPAPDGRTAETLNMTLTPATIDDPLMRRIGFSRKIGQINVINDRARLVLQVSAGSMAQAAGFQTFDALVGIDGRQIWTLDELNEYLAGISGRMATATVARLDESAVDGVPVRNLETILFNAPTDPATFGLGDGAMVVSGVEPDSPAAKAGIVPGDRIAMLDGGETVTPKMMLLAIFQNPEKPHTLKVARSAGQEAEIAIDILNPDWEPGSSKPQYLDPGLSFRIDTWVPGEVRNRNIPGYALMKAWDETSRMFVVTIASLGAVATGRVSVKELGGPIMIFDLAGKAGSQGLVSFLSTMMFISISLGVMNLLPIPLLDGGHIVMFGWEKIRRRPPTMRERNVWSWIGLVILALLMLLVMKNDIFRIIS